MTSSKQSHQVLEKTLERNCRKVTKEHGGYFIKLNPIGCVGIPDRLLLLPGGVLAFVELKRPGVEKLRPKQTHWFDRLTHLGFIVRKINDIHQFWDLIDELT